MSNDGQNPDEIKRPGDDDDLDITRAPANTGFGMLDWLTLPAEEREIVIWLTRRQRATRDEIVEAFGDSVPGIDALLEQMLVGNYIRLDSSEDPVVFTVVYRHQQKRATREFPDDIWSRVDTKYGRRKDLTGNQDDSNS